MNALHHLLYVSRAHVDPCSPDIRCILEVGRVRNAGISVTGLLVYSGDHFVQWLEGPLPQLEAVMQSIRHDERHTILHEWRARPISHRCNGHWSLGYVYDDSVENWLRALQTERRPLPPIEEVIQTIFSRADFDRGGHML